MKLRAFLLFFLSAFLVSCSNTVKISPGSSDTKIREIVLFNTPLGSSPDTVLKFIQHRLQHEGDADISDRGAVKRKIYPGGTDEVIGSKSIQDVEIGPYLAGYPLVPMVTYVYVSWAFDDHDRLIDVLVYEPSKKIVQ